MTLTSTVTLTSVATSLLLVFFSTIHQTLSIEHEQLIKFAPGKCDVCKYLVTELQTRLNETGKNKEKIPIGHGIDPDKKRKIIYKKSELRLIEALQDPHVCERLLDYDIHKEREGSLRFGRGRSQTMQELQGLANRGVKVEMDVPYVLWNETSAEVRELHRMCFTMVGDYEEDIEQWYYQHQDHDLMDYLCEKRVLKHAKVDTKCLYEKASLHDKAKAIDSRKVNETENGNKTDNAEKKENVEKTKESKENVENTKSPEKGNIEKTQNRRNTGESENTKEKKNSEKSSNKGENEHEKTAKEKKTASNEDKSKDEL